MTPPLDSLHPKPIDTTRTFGGPGRVVDTDDTHSRTRPADASTPHGETTPFFPHIPRYQILESLGHGGMGHVFLASDTQLRRRVALKFMLRPAEAPPTARRRFDAEATILAQLHHPNVIEVYDSGEASGFRFFAMTYLAGGSLSKRRDEFRTAGAAAGVMAAVARGVQHAHERGIVHRDLKASNVMFDGDRPVVTDFGCAKWEESDHSTHGFALFGTPSHMPPEVVSHGSKVHDGRSDVWSLGVMLYHLLAGELPFPDDPRTKAGKLRLLTQHPPAVRACAEAVPGVDDRLEAVVRKALAKNPDERYRSAAEFAADLEQWLAGAEVAATTAPQPSALFHDGSTTRRPFWPLLLAGLLGCGVVAAVLTWWPPSVAPPPTTAPVVPPPTTPIPTLAERLKKKGDAVEFIGPTGLPTERRGELAGVSGGAREGAGQVCEVDAARAYLLELGSEPLPFPYRLEGEARVTLAATDTKVGFYTDRESHPQPDQSMTHAAFVNCFGPMTRAEARKVAKFIGKDGWGATPARVALTNSVFLPINEKWQPVAQDPPPPADEPGPFHTLAIEVYPDRWRAYRDGVEFKKADTRLFATQLVQDAFVTGDERLAGPPLGHGFGLFVFQGSGQFRSVRLIRLAD